MLQILLNILSEEFFYSAIRIATPIAIAAMGEVFLERSGIINLSIEGMILIGAFFGVLGSALTGSAFMGLLLAIIASALTALLFGLWVIKFQSNQIVVGAALNILALGLTSFLSRVIFGMRAIPIQVAGIEPLHLPILSDIPIVGRIFFQHPPLVYFAFVLVPLSTFVLFRTTWGLKVRSIGENPRAADTVGINVYKWRYLMAVLAGILCGIAGADISLALLNTFNDNMVGGRGIIAMAVVIFSGWNPMIAGLTALAFGAIDAFQLRFQAFGVGIPYEFFTTLPYMLTLVAVIFSRSRTSMPAALMQPYVKESI